jgi:hypothetical protein
MIPRQGIMNQTSLKRSKVYNTEDALYGQVMPANYAKSSHSFSHDVDIYIRTTQISSDPLQVICCIVQLKRGFLPMVLLSVRIVVR